MVCIIQIPLSLYLFTSLCCSYSLTYSQKGDENIKREGMVVLKEIWKKERGYKVVIEESPLVKNAVSLGGRRRKEGGRDIWEKEGEGEGEGEKEDGGGGRRKEGGRDIWEKEGEGEGEGGERDE